MNFRIVNSLSEECWRSFVENHPLGNIFHTPDMFQVFQRAKWHTPQIWASIDEDGAIQAILPLVNVALHKGFLHVITTRAIAYGGVLASDNPSGKEALSSLLKEYIHNSAGKALFTELRHLSDVSYLKPVIEQRGFRNEDHLDFLIDLRYSSEQILQNIGSRTRKHIRKGLRKGNVTIDVLTRKEQIIDWYNLVRNTYQSARVPLADYSLFEAAFDILQPRGMIRFWLARIGGTNVAASAELLYKDNIYGWYGGVDREYADEVPGEMLMWHILKWGAESGYRLYDFGGAGKPNEEYRVRNFKAKFGGMLVCYGRDIYTPHKLLLSISKQGYKLYKKLFF